MKKGIIIIIVFITVFIAFKQNAYSGLEEEKRKLEQYKQELEAVKKSLREVTDYSAQLEALIGNLNSEIVIVEKQIEETKANINSLELQIKEKEGQIKTKEEEIKLREGDLESTIGFSYKMSNYSTMELLFEGQDPQSISKRIAYLSYISSYTKKLMDQAIADKKTLQEKKQNLANDKANLENFLYQKEKEEEILKEEIEMKESIVKALKEKKSYYLYKKEEIEKIIEEENKLIAKLIEEARKSQLKLEENLIWPVRGTITSNYGQRIHPIFGTKDFHEGIDISAPSGTPIKAVAYGKVSYAGWMTGYGNVIIIYHGSDVSTLYAHLSTIKVKNGQVVKQGDIIGNVGSTGWSTGPHLHFGIYVGEQAVNPLSYLP